MARYVCPMCGSEEIYPIFAKDNIWKCLKCGYTGPAQEIKGNLEYFWDSYMTMKNRK